MRPSGIKKTISGIGSLGTADKQNLFRQVGRLNRRAVRKAYLNKTFPTGKNVSIGERAANLIIKKTPAKYTNTGYSKLVSRQSGTYFKELGQDISHPTKALKRVFSNTTYRVSPGSKGTTSIIKKSPVGRIGSRAFTYGIPAWFAVEPWTAKRFKKTSTGGKILSSATGGLPDLITRRGIPIMGFNWISEALAKPGGKI